MPNINQKSQNEVISKCLLWWILGICMIISLFFVVLFWQNREWNCSWPIDNGLMGNYGDLIGGVVGTIVAFYSAYLLVRTFQSQETVNRNVIETNKNIVQANNEVSLVNQNLLYNTLLEVFNNKFECFISGYQKAIDNYVFKDDNFELIGRKAFEKLSDEFVKIDFDNKNDYLRRCQSAVSDYMEFYSNNRLYLAVHFRMLYLLASLVSASDLNKDDKVLYAKLVRGQLSESEMTMLRYNCHSEYGEKMQKYCNEFNLIKHLPVMQLLEFKTHYKILHEKVNNSSDNNFKELIVGLDTMFITLRKYAKILLEKDSKRKIIYDKCKGYVISMYVTDDRKNFTVKLLKNIGAERRGGGARLSATEKALDCYSERELSDLFQDYLSELFYVSNYYQYNGKSNVKKGHITQDGQIYECMFTIDSNKRLALSLQQVIDREQNILNN